MTRGSSSVLRAASRSSSSTPTVPSPQGRRRRFGFLARVSTSIAAALARPISAPATTEAGR